MATKKKVSKKKAAPKKKAVMTSRQKILKYCEVVKVPNQLGCELVFGKHKLRMNRSLANVSNTECDKIVKNLMKRGLSTHIKQVEKGAASMVKRRAVTTTDPKPCECGCRAITRRGSRFLPGHDMKLKSRLIKAAKKDNAKAKKELKSRGWA